MLQRCALLASVFFVFFCLLFDVALSKSHLRKSMAWVQGWSFQMLLRRKFGEPISRKALIPLFFCARGQMEIVFRTKHSIAHSGAFYETKKKKKKKTENTKKKKKKKGKTEYFWALLGERDTRNRGYVKEITTNKTALGKKIPR